MSGDFRETLATVDARGNRVWVYPSIVWGALRRRRTVVSSILMAVYLLMPWISIHGEQAVFFDIVNRTFTVFGITFWATDTVYLFLLLGTLAFSLFFFTALLGRVWCGWACPTTVFMEFLFRPVEQLIEGKPAERKRLDAAPWTAAKYARKALKLAVFAFLSWILATTFLAYFVGREQLQVMIVSSPALHPWLFSLTCFFVGVCLFQFGWFREQFCTVLCPYARFQSVMMDSNSITVGYDVRRGEPRGKKNADSVGDCVDCGLCVRVCPTGIDIRNGLQLECVQCASCIDACNSIMTKIGRAPGLIRYSTENELNGRGTKIFRPRVFVYAAILAVYSVAFVVLLSGRQTSEFQVVRGARDVPFSVVDASTVSNHLTVHISNKGRERATYRITLENEPDIAVTVPVDPFPIGAESMAEVPIFVKFPRALLSDGKRRVVVEVRGSDGFTGKQPVTLLGPEV